LTKPAANGKKSGFRDYRSDNLLSGGKNYSTITSPVID